MKKQFFIFPFNEGQKLFINKGDTNRIVVRKNYPYKTYFFEIYGGVSPHPLAKQLFRNKIKAVKFAKEWMQKNKKLTKVI